MDTNLHCSRLEVIARLWATGNLTDTEAARYLGVTVFSGVDFAGAVARVAPPSELTVAVMAEYQAVSA